MMGTYKKEMTIDVKNQCIKEIPQLLNCVHAKGRILKEEFDVHNQPIDTDSDGKE